VDIISRPKIPVSSFPTPLVRKNKSIKKALPDFLSAALKVGYSFILHPMFFMTHKSLHWVDRFYKSLPCRDSLAAHPWLRPIANRLLAPQLWHFQHESVARGVAIGTFWAFAIPAAQIVVSAAHCPTCRANIPAAAAMTMITNPFTIGFWLWLAYQAGALALGVPADAVLATNGGASSWLGKFGWPTVMGMCMFALGGAVLSYVGVKLIWRLRIWFKRRLRRKVSA